MRGIVSCRIRKALGGDKNEKIVEYLGCTIQEFKDHIESKFKPDMNWENYGTLWHIDHVVPIKYANPTVEDVIERLHWTNTQPLYATENIAKGNRFIG